ncbi:NAD(P)/FAD-dependent oxidoreductase [Thiomicrospira cyclica]|uniref:Nitrite reductase (NAD(P)H) n=1 Tax=Thiomicrospira cyclica (strain DSM 14477 / JCM 11371 / ALM1) TaxID=717773 RepID=F6DCG7_THICA|nr:FAD-dependent oxidoreductase [Thiomicrospira cyclica]AEG31553.1 Nitrite reductase (NAD(P)H) [Thiomicrospira cyclica ALM1]
MQYAKKPRLIIIGLGMASMRLLDELVKRHATQHYAIEVLSGESTAGYNRILLSYVLSGEKTLDSITSHNQTWFDQQGIKMRLGCQVTELDPICRCVTTASGDVLAYDYCVIATGSNAQRLNIPGAKIPGTYCFRDCADAKALQSIDVNDSRPVLVVGAGLLGLEAAYGLVMQGHLVTVVHRSDRILSQQLDFNAGQQLQRSLQKQGIQFVLNRQLDEIHGGTEVAGVRLNKGEELSAKAIVMAVGIVPNTALANQAGLLVNKGIVVDGELQTSAAGVFALGECCEFEQQTFGLVAPIYRQASILADQLMHKPTQPFAHQLSATRLKVSGVEVFSFGEPNQQGDHLVFQDPTQGIYRKLVLVEGRIASAILLGNTQDANWLFDLYQQQTQVAAQQRSALLFGQAYFERIAA